MLLVLINSFTKNNFIVAGNQVTLNLIEKYSSSLKFNFKVFELLVISNKKYLMYSQINLQC
jgi:hypothetical protein